MNNIQEKAPFKRCDYNEDTDCELICVEKNGKHGCINKNGKLVIPFISDTDIFFNNNGNYAVISQGWNSDENNYKIGKYGYINRKGEIVIPCKYADASDFIGKYAVVDTQISSNDGISAECLTECIDENGEVRYEFGTNKVFYINGNGVYHTTFTNVQNILPYSKFSLSSNG